MCSHRPSRRGPSIGFARVAVGAKPAAGRQQAENPFLSATLHMCFEQEMRGNDGAKAPTCPKKWGERRRRKKWTQSRRAVALPPGRLRVPRASARAAAPSVPLHFFGAGCHESSRSAAGIKFCIGNRADVPLDSTFLDAHLMGGIVTEKSYDHWHVSCRTDYSCDLGMIGVE